MEANRRLQALNEMPVSQAVLRNALPAILSMMMALVYNLADTFFIGQTHDPYMVAAVSLATPVFLIFLALGSLFGVGGTSLISRALGGGDVTRAKKACSFCMWACIGVGLAGMAAFLLGMDGILAVIGTSPDTAEYTRTYLEIVTLSAPFVLIGNCFSNIVRAEGRSAMAMIGPVAGNLTNVILDPIMILGFGWDVAGAAWATLIGNVVGALIYIVYFLAGKSSLSVNIRDFTMKQGICSGILVIGVPASLSQIMMSVSSVLLNGELARYGDMAVAAMGVAIKIVLIINLIAIGLSQGVQPLVGYSVGGRDWRRFKAVLRFSLLFALGLCLALTVVCFLGADWMSGLFLTDEEALAYAGHFARIQMSTTAIFGVFFVFLSSLQAMGAAIPSFIISLSRQGLIYIPILYLMENLLGLEGLVWTQPAADVLSTILVALLFLFSARRMMRIDAVPAPPGQGQTDNA